MWTFSQGPSPFPLPGDPPPSPFDFPQVEIGVLNRDKVQKTLRVQQFSNIAVAAVIAQDVVLEFVVFVRVVHSSSLHAW